MHTAPRSWFLRGSHCTFRRANPLDWVGSPYSVLTHKVSLPGCGGGGHKPGGDYKQEVSDTCFYSFLRLDQVQGAGRFSVWWDLISWIRLPSSLCTLGGKKGQRVLISLLLIRKTPIPKRRLYPHMLTLILIPKTLSSNTVMWNVRKGFSTWTRGGLTVTSAFLSPGHSK